MHEHSPTAIEQHEHSTWEASADIYADAIGLMTALSGQAEIATDLGNIDNRSRVLDVGCGVGQLSNELSKIAKTVEGIDFSANMVTVASATYPQLTFTAANAESLPFAADSFDVAVCNYTAHHFARPEVVFRELKRVLCSGGRVVVIHPIQAEQVSFGSFAEALYEQLPPEQLPSGPLLDVAHPQDYIDLLSNCGYGSVTCERRIKPVKMDNINLLLEAGWKIGNLIEQPQSVQDKIREGTISRARRFLDSNGNYSFPDVILAASGAK